MQPERDARRATGAAVVSLEGVVKSYPRFRLGPVNLEVESGYVVAVVGPNGSGKTTLFRMLMNLVHPDAGEIRLFSERYPGSEVGIKRRIGYVPERSVGHDELTAEGLGSFVSRWYPSWNGKLYRDLVRRFEIDKGQRFGRLSKGMQRRLAFAVAVACEPELLLLDEPTEGVDPFARRTMMEEISRFMHNGRRTVLFATHVVDEVRRIADFVAFMHDGAFLGFYEKDSLLQRWRTLWVERAPRHPNSVPGLVSVEEGTPVRLVTDSPTETETVLRAQGIEVVGTRALELEEILAHLTRKDREGKERSGGPS